jgi:hypothetical protein
MKNKIRLTKYLTRNVQYLFVFSFCLVPFHALSNQSKDNQLTLHPKKCVSLRQGQTCYVDIELQWSVKVNGNYCLYASNIEEPLQCWTQAQEGRFATEFSSDENTYFYLKHEQKTLAEVELKMSWVYKRKRSSVSWRVF